MKEKKNGPHGLNPQEIKLIDQPRQQPRIMERGQRILEIAQSVEGPLKTADEVEELLIQEMRQLGNTTMNEWATQAQERVSQELQTEDPSVLKRKKKR